MNLREATSCAVLLTLAGCSGALPAQEGSSNAPARTVDAPVQPVPHVVRSFLRLTQRELGAAEEQVVAEQRGRCEVMISASSRGVQAWLRQPAAPGARSASVSDPEATPRGLLRAWLPAWRVSAGERYTRLVPFEIAGRRIELAHTVRVVQGAGGPRILMSARGQRRWGDTGLTVEVQGEGEVSLAAGRVQWPERIEVCYRVLVSSGAAPADAVESSLRYVQTLEEPSS